MAEQSRTVLEEYGKYVDVDNIRSSENTKIGNDLSRFDNREEVRRAVEAAQQQETYRSQPKENIPPRSKVSFGTVMIFVLFAIIASLLINCYVKQNALAVELAELKSDYAEAQTRNSDLQTRFDQRYVLSDIEEYATGTLGMVKIETNQIEYIEIDTPEIITKLDADNDNGFNLISYLAEKLQDLLEFLT